MAALPLGGPVAAGTSTITDSWDGVRLVQYTVSPLSADVSLQFKINSADVGSAITVEAGDTVTYTVKCDSAEVTRSTSTAVTRHAQEKQ